MLDTDPLFQRSENCLFTLLKALSNENALLPKYETLYHSLLLKYSGDVSIYFNTEPSSSTASASNLMFGRQNNTDGSHSAFPAVMLSSTYERSPSVPTGHSLNGISTDYHLLTDSLVTSLEGNSATVAPSSVGFEMGFHDRMMSDSNTQTNDTSTSSAGRSDTSETVFLRTPVKNETLSDVTLFGESLTTPPASSYRQAHVPIKQELSANRSEGRVSALLASPSLAVASSSKGILYAI